LKVLKKIASPHQVNNLINNHRRAAAEMKKATPEKMKKATPEIIPSNDEKKNARAQRKKQIRVSNFATPNYYT
jgi:hypothetical protein